MSKIKDSVLDNPKFNIKELPIAYFTENKDSDLLRNQYIKNTIKQTEEELSDLAKFFFSDLNIDLINKQLVLKVYKISNKKYHIPFQDKDKLLIVMRYVWIQYSKNLNFRIREQIKELNCHVVSEILPDIITNIEQHFGYLDVWKREEESKFKLNKLPVNTRIGKGTLPSISETFHSTYKAPF